MRITVNGKRTEIATGRRFDINRWENGRIVGRSADAKELQMDLEIMKAMVNRIWREMCHQHEEITAAKIKERFEWPGKKKKMKNKDLSGLSELKFEED